MLGENSVIGRSNCFMICWLGLGRCVWVLFGASSKEEARFDCHHFYCHRSSPACCCHGLSAGAVKWLRVTGYEMSWQLLCRLPFLFQSDWEKVLKGSLPSCLRGTKVGNFSASVGSNDKMILDFFHLILSHNLTHGILVSLVCFHAQPHSQHHSIT